jgi:hypothetical protein
LSYAAGQTGQKFPEVGGKAGVPQERLFNKCRSDQTPRSWELYRDAKREYRRKLRRASKETWRAFFTSINKLPRAARLQKARSKDHKLRLGFLVTPTGERTQSEGETLDLLLRTHLPSSGAAGVVATANYCHATRRDSREAEGVVTYRRVVWAIESFVPYKSPGRMGSFLPFF